MDFTFKFCFSHTWGTKLHFPCVSFCGTRSPNTQLNAAIHICTTDTTGRLQPCYQTVALSQRILGPVRGAGRNDWQVTGTVNTEKIPSEPGGPWRRSWPAHYFQPTPGGTRQYSRQWRREKSFWRIALPSSEGWARIKCSPGRHTAQGETPKCRHSDASSTPQKKWSVQSSSGTSSAPQKNGVFDHQTQTGPESWSASRDPAARAVKLTHLKG